MAIGGVKEIRERMKSEHATDKVLMSQNTSILNASSFSGSDYPYVTLFF
jgi:hypothetical protein